MFKRIAWTLRKACSEQMCVFVIGTGRSGTHWLGRILEGHPEIRATVEDPEIFGIVTEMALNQEKKPDLLPVLVSLYSKVLSETQPWHYVDKSHPNIWFAEDLFGALPNVYCIGILRDPYATVSSMLLHEGVRRWCEKWDQFPVPNLFLGITMENRDGYAKMSIAQRCAVRWVAHFKQMNRLKEPLGNRLLVVSYEDLILQTDVEVDRIMGFLGLKGTTAYKTVKKESLYKWKKNLADADKAAVKAILGEHGLEA